MFGILGMSRIHSMDRTSLIYHIIYTYITILINIFIKKTFSCLCCSFFFVICGNFITNNVCHLHSHSDEEMKSKVIFNKPRNKLNHIFRGGRGQCQRSFSVKLNKRIQVKYREKEINMFQSDKISNCCCPPFYY